MKSITLKGKGVTITTSPEVAAKLVESKVLDLKVVDPSINGCELGSCGICTRHEPCVFRETFHD